MAPSTTYIRTIVVVPDKASGLDDTPDSEGVWTRAEIGNLWLKMSPVDMQTPVDLTVLSFDGSYSKNRVLTTNYYNLLDDAPTGIPLALRANIRGFVGYSLPFVTAPSEHTIQGKYIPVEMDVVVSGD